MCPPKRAQFPSAELLQSVALLEPAVRQLAYSCLARKILRHGSLAVSMYLLCTCRILQEQPSNRGLNFSFKQEVILQPLNLIASISDCPDDHSSWGGPPIATIIVAMCGNGCSRHFWCRHHCHRSHHPVASLSNNVQPSLTFFFLPPLGCDLTPEHGQPPLLLIAFPHGTAAQGDGLRILLTALKWQCWLPRHLT